MTAAPRHRWILSLAVAIVPLPLAGQARPAILTGRILDAGSRRPIPDVTVVLGGVDRAAHTDSLGTFRFDDLSAGLLPIRLTRIGYAPVERNVNVMSGRTTEVEYVLTSEAARLPEVEVTGQADAVEGPAILAGFEERRAMGGGVFLDQKTLKRWETRKVSDVLRGTANLRLISSGRDVKVASNRQLARSMRTINVGRPCYLDLIVDGQLIWSETREGESGSLPPNIDDVVSTFELAAVEAYMSTASIPLKYRSIGNACGALMFWTKRGLTKDEPPHH